MWVKGHGHESLIGPYGVTVRATLLESDATIAGPVTVLVQVSHRYEWILVGTIASNARLVLLDRVYSEATPVQLP